MAECGLCKDCRWWEQNYRMDHLEEGKKHYYDIGRCDRIYESGALFDVTATGWGEFSSIETNKNFGCIQFAPKEAS